MSKQIIIVDVCMDFEPHFKLRLYHGQMTDFNMIFHVVASNYEYWLKL